MASPRRSGRPGGLRFQLLLGLISLLILALFLVALATLQLHKRQLQQLSAEEARRHLVLLESIESDERARLLADDLILQPGILYAGFGPHPSSTELTLPAPGATLLSSWEGSSAIIARGNSTRDSLVVLSLEEPARLVASSRQALLLYLGLTLLFVSLVGYAFFSFVVIRPLRALAVATTRAAEGDLASPVQLLPRNELGALARQFNTMLERLDAQRAELQHQVRALQLAHQDLQDTQESLIRSEKLATVGQLAAGVAHEVGNPLAAVMGYTELLRDRRLQQEDADDLAKRSLTQLKRIRQIIRQLLDYTRQEPVSQPRPIDLCAVIDEALHLVRTTPAAREVEILLDAADPLPEVLAHPGELSQVLVNLLFNSLHAIEGAGTISLQLSVQAQSVEIHLRDSGPGIAPEIAPRIFDPFFTTRDVGEGTGLGLAIAQRLITRMGGEILLHPSSEEGAHFQITLQEARSEPPLNDITPPHDSGASDG